MRWFEETTEWTESTPNHTYLMDESRGKMFAYVRAGTQTPRVFAKPITISVRGRKFRPVADRWNVKIETHKPEGRSWQVQGSRGDTYTVREHEGRWDCTCSGFKFRSKCKHVEAKQK
jgi:hypothetical protein